MNNKDKYFQIINNRIKSPLPITEYGEKHHIIPKSICYVMKNEQTNIVRLTAEEHFKAHYYLLCWFMEIKEPIWSRKMGCAISKMKHNIFKHIQQDNLDEISKLYANSRIMIQNTQISNETRRKMSKSRLGKKHTTKTRKIMSDNVKGNKNPFYGKKHSEKTRKLITQNNISRAKRILQYDYNGNVINIFINYHEASESLSISESYVKSICNRTRQPKTIILRYEQ